MKTLTQRLKEELSRMETKFKISFSDSEKEKLLKDKVVGYSVNNTYDKVVEAIENEVKERIKINE